MASKKWLFIILVAFLFAGSCSSNRVEDVELTDLNLFLRTDSEIDSVFISNITQDKLYQFLPYADTIRIASNNTINDLYNINFYAGGELTMNRLWLSGEKIIIQGYVNDKLQLKIDTVIGSDLYYKSVEYNNKQKELTKLNNVLLLDDFQLKSFEENIANSFSIEIATNYFMRNVSNNEALYKLYELQTKQDSAIIGHLLNPIKRIERILFENKVDLSRFQFYTKGGELISLNLNEGDKYLLDFWFVGCAPCVQDHKLMKEQLAFLKKHHVEVIGISTDRDQAEWVNYLKSKNYSWCNVRDVDDYEKRASKSMFIDVFPTYILIDRQGKVLYRTFSFSEVMKYLSR
ncbi:MAG: TlpA family protein disulfide reductase [Cyclobacteriaceae bacterium]|nr:TlpA family protein disulfide reductase [Cyclobacteriaceae bacterium]